MIDSDYSEATNPYASQLKRKILSPQEMARAVGRWVGFAEGYKVGCVDIAMELLEKRFGCVAEMTRRRFLRASVAELRALTKRIYSAHTLIEALGELDEPRKFPAYRCL